MPAAILLSMANASDEEMKESSPHWNRKLKLCRQLSGQCVLKSPAKCRTNKPKSGHI